MSTSTNDKSRLAKATEGALYQHISSFAWFTLGIWLGGNPLSTLATIGVLFGASIAIPFFSGFLAAFCCSLTK